MKYFNKVTSLKIDKIEFKYFNIIWDYSINGDDTVANLNLTLFNLKKETINLIKKGSQIEFGFGYGDKATDFFKGIVDSVNVTFGITKEINISSFEYAKGVFKKISRSYIKGTDSRYVIEDICKQSAFYLKELNLKNNIKYKHGYNIYDMPIIALKKIVGACGSQIKIDGDNIYIFEKNMGSNKGVEFNFDSGLLNYPNEIKTSESEEEKDESKPNSTHSIYTLGNPDVKKFDLIKVLGNEYRVDSINISDWKSTMEVTWIK
ncbi:MAG: hypothetical protein ACRDDH_18030 [Cetobacterium sp.]|uniref:hypothetical protein n=1 Tax=Cetobacterium sp. TaxID=2071632 RepID=UPI003EE47B6A